jgi:hypothetical protein
MDLKLPEGARVLDFLPREAYDSKRLEERAIAAESAQMTPHEVFTRLHVMTLEHLKHLVRQYKATGGWNVNAEALMTRVVADMHKICLSVSGDENGTPQEIKIS